MPAASHRIRPLVAEQIWGLRSALMHACRAVLGPAVGAHACMIATLDASVGRQYVELIGSEGTMADQTKSKVSIQCALEIHRREVV